MQGNRRSGAIILSAEADVALDTLATYNGFIKSLCVWILNQTSLFVSPYSEALCSQCSHTYRNPVYAHVHSLSINTPTVV